MDPRSPSPSDGPDIPGRIDLDGAAPDADPGRSRGRGHRRGGAPAAVLSTVLAVTLIAAVVVTVTWWRPWSGPPAPAAAPSWSVSGSAPASSPSSSSPSSGRPTTPGTPTATPRSVDPTAIDTGVFSPWSCAVDPEMPTSRAAFRGWVEAVMDCAGSVYRDRLPTAAASGEEPPVRFVDPGATTPCGAVDAAGWFCPTDATIYLDVPRLRRFADDNRLAVVSVLLHEYTHAVQHRLGVLSRTDRPERPMSDPDERVRRIELQADCLSLGLVSRWREAEWTETDRGRFLEWRFSGHDREHGSDASRVRWLLAGLDGQDFAACDTWSAPSWQVR